MKILTENAEKSGWSAEHEAYLDSNPSLFTDFFNTLKSTMIGLIDFSFKKTTQIVLEPTDEEFNVKRDIAKILPTKAEGGKLDWIDVDIEDWFGDVTLKGRELPITSFVYRLLSNLTHRQIVDTSAKFKIYNRYNIFDACTLAAKLIDAGEIEARGKGVSIYLKEEKNDTLCLCRLRVHRSDVGELGVILSEVGFNDDDLDSGDGVVFL